MRPVPIDVVRRLHDVIDVARRVVDVRVRHAQELQERIEVMGGPDELGREKLELLSPFPKLRMKARARCHCGQPD